MPKYRIEYVEHKELIRLLQDAHDYAAANEHRADYWTCMAAYLAAEGLTYRYTPPKGPPLDLGQQTTHSTALGKRITRPATE